MGNSPRVNTYSSDVLPHAPSPTITSFLLTDSDIYLFRGGGGGFVALYYLYDFIVWLCECLYIYIFAKGGRKRGKWIREKN